MARDFGMIDSVGPQGSRGDSANPIGPAPAARAAAPAGVRRLSPAMLAGAVRWTEFCLMLGTGWGLLLRSGALPTGVLVIEALEALVLTSVLVVALQGLNAFSVITIRSPGRFGPRMGLTWASLLGVAWLLHTAVTRAPATWIADWALLGGACLAMERLGFAAVVRTLARRGLLSRRAVIVGGGDDTTALLEILLARRDPELEILGVFDDRSDERSPEPAGVPKLGTVGDLVGFARHTPIDLIIVSLPIRAEHRLLMMLKKLWVLPVDIRLAAHMSRLRFHPRAYSFIGPVAVLDVFDRPITDWNFIAKAVFDRVVGALCLLVAAPVMLLVALAVKLDSPGPVLFRQHRHGFNNEVIEVLKFRSMHIDQQDPEASKLVTRADPRVTRVGRFIRKTSLDELPQLLNVVVMGNLSLVGPRPHAVRGKAAGTLYDDVVDGYFARHRVMPGITGWAQINGWRGATDTAEKIQKRVECDLYYIENWSLLFDLYILAATSVALFNTKNAY